MCKLIFQILFLFIYSFTFSQTINEQLELVIENDKLVMTDRYYTSGLFLTYKRDFQDNLLFKKTDENVIQLNITLGNQTYTPANLSSFDPQDFERPYAGWFFLKAEIREIKRKHALFFGIEAGITGEEALSGKLQSWLHGLTNIPVPIWAQEIEHKFLVNLSGKYILEKRIDSFNSIVYEVESLLGLKDVFIENSLRYYFGKYNNLKNSSRMGIIDKVNLNELYGFMTIAHRWVFHNTLIQGSLDYKDRLFTTTISNHILKYKLGAVWKRQRHTFRFIFNFNTKETPKSTSHSYGTISFARDF